MMIKPITTLLLLSSLASFSSAEQLRSVASNQSNTVRLIVSGELSTTSAQTMAHASSIKTDSSGYSVVEVDEKDADSMISLLKQQPGVRSVERDFVATNPPMPKISPEQIQDMVYEMSMARSFSLSGDHPNDPEYLNQYAWKVKSDLLNGQHNILDAYKKSTPKRKIRIGMTDSGFYDREDITYAGGYNLATHGESTISPIFFENEWNPLCTTPHGGSVAHIIGANTDNGIGVAGIVDADLFGVRVMDCGTGFLSDMANGIRWLAGDTTLSGDITPIDQPVDIINISMGVQVNDETCPDYVQNAINYAYGKGIAVFAAAGNNGIDAKEYTPANCDNVITVGSIDRYGKQSDFSNYGPAIDVAALGEMVRSQGTIGYAYWMGTSFATPNTVGMAALAKQASPSMSVDELYNYVKSTTHNFNAGNTTHDLGTGIMNADQLMTSVNQFLIENVPMLNPAMDASQRCQKDALSSVPFMDDKGNPVEACAIFEMDASLIESETGFPNRSLYRVAQGQAYNLSGAELIKASESEKFIVYNLDPKKYDYGLASCDSGNVTCSSEVLIPVNDDFVDESRYCVKP